MPQPPSDPFLTAVLESTAYAVIATRTDGVITVFNRSAERLLGWSAAELIDRQTPGIFHDGAEVVARAAELSAQLGRQVAPGFEVFVLMAREEGLADERPWTYVRKDGSRVPVLLSVTAVRDREGVLIGYLGVARDVSELRIAERAAAEGEQRFRSVFEGAVDGIFVVDEQGVIQDVNPAAARCFGWAVPEMLGRNLAMLMPGLAGDASWDQLRRFFAGSGPQAMGGEREVEAMRRDGSRFHAELAVAESRVGGRRICIGTVRDVSVRRQAEAAMRDARDAAEAANRAKSDFLANISHEVRTPLNGIVGMTGLLLESSLSASQRDHAETVRSCSEVLLQLINDLLDFAKIEAGRMEIESIPFDPLLVAEEAVALVTERANAKGLVLRLLPSPDLPRSLVGDPGRIRQVLLNLVANAVKFTEHGSVEVELAIDASACGAGEAQLQAVVRDTGIGMEAAVVERLFQPFTQADASTTRRFGGTGLGLSICRRLVELMGGAISVDSAPGRGSAFRFTVRARCGAPSLVDVAAVPAMSGLPVLVVDDHAGNRQLLRHLLIGWGMRPFEVVSGPEAISCLRTAATSGQPFAVVLSDMQMPGMDGLALAEVVRADPMLASVPVVLISSATDRLVQERAIAVGVREVLAKPVRQGRLLECLGRIVGGQAGERRASVPTALAGRVLIADDNAVNQRVALALCAKLGLRADAVGDGQEAVDASGSIDYDLILMDCQMPELDGYGATRAIRAREAATGARRIPVIALTAHAMRGDRERCLAAGMDDYISKPIRIEDLRVAAGRWLPVVAPSAIVPSKPAAADPGAAMDPILNPQVLAGLRSELGPEAAPLIVEMLAAFTEDSAMQLAAFESAPTAPAQMRAAHRLRGSALNLGAVALAAICAKAEAAANAGDMSAARAFVPEMRECLRLTKLALQEQGGS